MKQKQSGIKVSCFILWLYLNAHEIINLKGVRMKKRIASLLVVLMMFSLTGNVFAEDASCNNCKCPVWAVPCPEVVTEQGATGSTMCPFDYDAMTGYCNAPPATMAERNCKVILDICSCPQACQIVVGNTLGIQIEIITPGVYWAENTPSIQFELFNKTNITGACNDTTINDGVPVTDNRSIGGISYFMADGATAATPNPACRNTVTNAEKAKILLSNDITQGYVITQDDTINKSCQMWIDIPAMIVNAAEYTEAMRGQEIQIKVGIFTDWTWVTNADNYLCPTCVHANLCECTITVGKFCCDAPVENFSMLFPYFAPDTDASYFWNGIVISNLTDTAGSATLTIYEMDGDVGSATVAVPARGIYNSLLRNIAGVTVTKSGAGDTSNAIGNSKAYIKVCTNFNADGFAMLSDQSGAGESMGYLPRIGDDAPVCP